MKLLQPDVETVVPGSLVGRPEGAYSRKIRPRDVLQAVEVRSVNENGAGSAQCERAREHQEVMQRGREGQLQPGDANVQREEADGPRNSKQRQEDEVNLDSPGVKVMEPNTRDSPTKPSVLATDTIALAIVHPVLSSGMFPKRGVLMCSVSFQHENLLGDRRNLIVSSSITREGRGEGARI